MSTNNFFFRKTVSSDYEFRTEDNADITELQTRYDDVKLATSVTPDINSTEPTTGKTYLELLNSLYDISFVGSTYTLIKGQNAIDFEKQQAEGNFSLIGVPEGEYAVRNNVTGEIAQ